MMSPKIIELGPLKILSPIKSMMKIENTVRVKFFQTLGEKKPKVLSMLGAFIQGKWLSSGKKKKLCGIFTCPIPILHFAGLR